MDSYIFVALMALAFYAIVGFNKRRAEKAKVSAFELDARLDNKRSEIVVVASSGIPGKEIQNVLGAVTGISNTQASSKEEFELAEKEAMLALIEKAQRLGANAIVDLKLSTGSYQQQGSQWQVSQAVYNGTAVIAS
ncbi:MAG: heavy metal-binding domain-containing protein [Sideroxydans sp.]|nr:heavy metal-binding domain-containing protein [Sideroxydans sp.]